MFLRRLFYACAAILCLALAYHARAYNAQAQAPAATRYVGFWAYGPVVLLGTDLYQASMTGWEPYQSRVPALPVAPSEVLCVEGDANGGVLITTGGELFVTQSAHPWSSLGFVSGGGSTTVESETWGGIKSRFKK